MCCSHLCSFAIFYRHPREYDADHVILMFESIRNTAERVVAGMCRERFVTRVLIQHTLYVRIRTRECLFISR
jgi:hypothetical protein